MGKTMTVPFRPSSISSLAEYFTQSMNKIDEVFSGRCHNAVKGRIWRSVLIAQDARYLASGLVNMKGHNNMDLHIRGEPQSQQSLQVVEFTPG